MILLDNHDSSIIGTAEVWDSSGRRTQTVIYDGSKLMQEFMDDGLTEEDALEHISFNIEGGYLGLATPIIVWPSTVEQIHEMADDDGD